MRRLLEQAPFLQFADTVGRNGVTALVELDADGGGDAAEAARRVGVRAYIHCPEEFDSLAARYTDAQVYSGTSAEFLSDVLPALQEHKDSVVFWLDPNTATFEQDIATIQDASTHVPGVDWYVMHKAQYAKKSPFDASDPRFDRNWAGPPELAPAVMRNQMEKDTWYSCNVEDEYRVPDFKPEDVVVDIGAHIGGFSARAYRNGSRNVYSFEVDPWHIEAAVPNLRALGASQDEICLYHCAVVRGDSKRREHYYYNGEWNVFGGVGVEVASYSLDEIIDEVGDIRFLKIDCEGAEWEILYTCTQIERIAQIAGEYHENHVEQDSGLPPYNMLWLQQFLQQKGFGVVVEQHSENTGNFYATRVPATCSIGQDDSASIPQPS